MTPNLPPHLQEKMKKAREFHLYTKECTCDVNEFECAYQDLKHDFNAGYRQAYSDIMQELGPVVEALTELARPLMDTSITTVGQYDSYVCEEAEQVLKHLKERILNGNNT